MLVQPEHRLLYVSRAYLAQIFDRRRVCLALRDISKQNKSKYRENLLHIPITVFCIVQSQTETTTAVQMLHIHLQ